MHHSSHFNADHLISYAEASPLTWLSFLVTAWDQVDKTLMQSQRAMALLKNRKRGLRSLKTAMQRVCTNTWRGPSEREKY